MFTTALFFLLASGPLLQRISEPITAIQLPSNSPIDSIGYAKRLGGFQWKLTRLWLNDSLKIVPVSSKAYAQFSLGEQRVMGHGGCNRFSGKLTRLDKHSLGIGPLMSTRMACADVLGNRLETAFLAALNEADSYRVKGKRLTLLKNSRVLSVLMR